MPTATEASTLDAALAYARRGWPVIPLHSIQGGTCTCGRADCSSPGKHPRTVKGKDDATTDSTQIRDWWRKWPDANVGIVRGAASGIIVIDVDPRHGGDASLQSLVDEFGSLPPTVEAFTGGGGWHLISSHPGGEIRNRANVRPGIDVRGDGGYIAAPPSNHISGNCYRWDEGRAPGEIALAEMPAWLLDLIAREPTPRHEANGTAHTDHHGLLLQRAMQYVAKADSASEGGRNNSAFNLAGHLAAMDADGHRLNETEILELMRGWNLRCSPPLEGNELQQAVASALVNGTPRETKRVDPPRRERNGEPEERPRKPIERYTLTELREKFPKLNPPVIHGLIREGETANIIAPPKIGKSWLGYGLLISIATGSDWFGFKTTPGRAMLIDNELHPQTIADRMPKVGEAMGYFVDDYANQIDVISLRGRLRTLHELLDDLEDHGRYKAIVFDARYRFCTGESENDNEATTAMFNTLDQIAVASGAALFLIHHTSKGSQSEKSVTDVGSGAGAQSRAADSHIVLRPHEEDGIVVLDAVVRSFPPVEPVSLRWEFPLWQPCDADTSKLRGKLTATEQRQADRDKEAIGKIIAALREGPGTARQLRQRTGLSKERQDRLLDLLTAEGQVTTQSIKIRGNDCHEYHLSSGE